MEPNKGNDVKRKASHGRNMRFKGNIGVDKMRVRAIFMRTRKKKGDMTSCWRRWRIYKTH